MIISPFQIILMIGISVLIWIFAGRRWRDLSDFSHLRYSYIDFSFILLYFIEQFLLQIFLYYFDYSSYIVFGTFSMIILTTASLQNRWNACRIQRISDKSIEQREVFLGIQKESGIISKENEKLKDRLEGSSKYIQELYDELKLLHDKFKEYKKLKKKR